METEMVEINNHSWNVVALNKKAFLRFSNGWEVTDKVEVATSFGTPNTIKNGSSANTLAKKYGGDVCKVTQITSMEIVK